MNILVTGGAGYIGSHASQLLLARGHNVTILDNLFRGHAAAVDRLRGSLDAEAAARLHFVEADVADRPRVEAALKEHAIDSVMHFAALTYVGESVDDPLGYHKNNTAAVIELLAACQDAGVERFVFSSTAATYGEPEDMPIRETTPQHPINPYGQSKLHTEHLLRDFNIAQARAGKPFAFAALRYFNVAGADPTGVLGEHHDPETHLIPIILEAAQGKRSHVTIFGEDYPTPDGTCIRDYVHVTDLVEAHALVLEKLQPGDDRRYNLAIGRGYSVREVIDAAKRVTGKDFEVKAGERRPGDPPSLYADPTKINTELGWKARFTDLDETIATAWRWFNENPSGYTQ